jgi:WD40 repeat protein/serine/threonine protein kinase
LILLERFAAGMRMEGQGEACLRRTAMPSADREEALFAAALEKPTPAERAAYLDGACGGDHALRARIEALLAAHAASGGVLDAPPESLTSTGGYRPIPESPGTVIGRYKLLQQIGEGGMGVVYMAEQQEPVRRKVALKIIKPGMDSRQVIARFEAERQALALMDHQNIAKVLDAGTIGLASVEPSGRRDDADTRRADPPTLAGRPFFVMELVHGVKITKFCDDHKLTPRERLRLFIPVCQAIQHAHQKGIIHRDIKPSNVLVTMYDDKPVPKVIDFGVAKAIEQRLTEKTMFTQFGALVGTYEYMSPEQAEMNAFGVDTRSDVYSLGVVLYELLTGTTPLTDRHLREAALDEMLRLIKEEEAPPPSKKLSSSNNLPKIAAARGTEPARLSRLVRGEIDWIVMKCLEKDRSRRYDTASGLARDVERYLADEPVEACPPSARYLLSKFARKHRKALATAAAFAVMLAAATVVSACLALWAVSAEKEADQRRIDAEGAERDALAARDEADRRREEARFNQYVAQMNLVQREYEANNIEHVRELLDAQIPREPDVKDYRGFEWYYWHAMTHRELLVLPAPGDVTGLAYSPDGRQLAAATFDGPIHLWDAASGQKLATLKGAPRMSSWAYSPDSRRLAAIGRDLAIRVWDGGTGEERCTLGGLARPFFQVGFDPDGRRLVAVGGPATGVGYAARGTTVGLWDPGTGRQLLTIKGPRAGINQAAVSPDGRRLASGCVDSTVRVWDAATGRELLTLKGHSDSVRHVAFSADGRLLASVDVDWNARVWDAATGKQLHAYKLPRGLMGGELSFSPDGRRLVSRALRDQMRVWDAATGKELCALARTGLPYRVEFSPDGRRLAAQAGDEGGERRLLCVWDAATGQQVVVLKGSTELIGCVAFNPDGRRLASADGGTVRVWDATAGQEPFVLRGHWVAHIGFDSDSRLCAAGSGVAGSGATVLVWDAVTGEELFALGGHKQLVESVAFSPTRHHLASADGDGTVRVWDVGTGQALLTLTGSNRGPHFGRGVAFSPDGRRLASAGGDSMRIWNAVTGQEELSFKGPAGWAAESVAFSPGGRRLATVGDTFKEVRLSTLPGGPVPSTGWSPTGKMVVVWDAATGRQLLAIKRPLQAGNAVAFSPDGRRLAMAGRGAVQVWDAATGHAMLTLKCSLGSAGGVAFSPDGRRLASVSDEGVRVWDAATGQELLLLEGHPRLEGYGDLIFSPDGRRLAACSLRGVQIWEGLPVPAEARRRRAIVRSVLSLYASGILRTEVLAALRHDHTLSAEDRAFAVRAAETHSPDAEDAKGLNEAAWKVVSAPAAGRNAYTLALRRAEAAARAAADEFTVLGTLGVAQYRAGLYAEARDTLTRRAEHYPGEASATEAKYLAFLAMAQRRLGNTKEADLALGRLREIMKQPGWPADAEPQGFLREAAALFAQPKNRGGK